jgi:hypothetical protein
MVTIPPKPDEPNKTATKRDSANDRLTKLEKVVDLLCDHVYGVNCRPVVPEDSERGDEN